MEMKNIFTLNDWEFSQFRNIIILIQILMWIVGIISLNNIHIPLFNDIITLIYLAFIPGVIILRILDIHKIGNTFSTLLSVGLSILSVLLIGLFMNQVYPLFGITRPLENIPILVTFTIYNMILLSIAYYKDKNFNKLENIEFDNKLILSNQFIALCILPLVAIIGAYIFQYYGSNKIQMVLLVLICLVVIYMATGHLKKKYYHIALFSIAISILYYSTLISNHIWGYDIFFEYQFATYVIKNGIWDYTWPHAYNAMLSVVMFAPIYTKLSGMTLTWVLKFIYPFLFSLISVGLYKIFKQHTGSKIAFLATFFFIAYNGFSYGWMVQMSRQQIAEIFLVLLVYLMIDRKLPQKTRKLLYILFGVGLILSHYSVTYLFMFMLLATNIVLTLLSTDFGNIINTLILKCGFKNKYFGKTRKIPDQTISLPISIFFMIVIFVYYSLTADGKPIGSLQDALRIVSNNVFNTNIFTLTKIIPAIIVALVIVLGLYKLYKKISKDKDIKDIHVNSYISAVVSRIAKLSVKRKQILLVFLTILFIVHIWWPFNYLTILSIETLRIMNLCVYFIIIGLLLNFIKPELFHFTREYNTFAIFNLIILGCGIFIPAFRGQLSLQRIYEVTFVILAPFCITGAYYIINSFINLIKPISLSRSIQTSISIIGIFLVIFFILNTGLVDVLVGQAAPAPLDNEVDSPVFSQSEYAGVSWFDQYYTTEIRIYSDAFSNILLYWLNDIRTTNPKDMTDVKAGEFMFVRGYNIKHDTFLYGSGEYIPIDEATSNSNKIYDSGDSQVYKRVNYN